MYKDLLIQIVKYLRPKEEYYLFLEIYKEPHYHPQISDEAQINFKCYLHLICEVNNEIKMKHNIKCITVFDPDKKNMFLIDDFIFNDGLVIMTSECYVIGYCQPHIYISNKTFELNIITRLECASFYKEASGVKKEIANIQKLNNPYNKQASEHIVDIYKINRRSLESIKEAVQIFKKISRNMDIEDTDLTEREKKYVKIYEYGS